MASGFIILKDGRCLARSWRIYDYIIELVIEELLNEQCKEAIEFKEWLQTLIPNENDEYNGYGGFIKQATGENMQRWLDLRELTTKNQELFWGSLQKSLTKQITNTQFKKDNEESIFLLRQFLKMKYLADTGDDPSNLSDWKKGYVEPATNNRIGPGW